jgi:hypothetical protein
MKHDTECARGARPGAIDAPVIHIDFVGADRDRCGSGTRSLHETPQEAEPREAARHAEIRRARHADAGVCGPRFGPRRHERGSLNVRRHNFECTRENTLAQKNHARLSPGVEEFT